MMTLNSSFKQAYAHFGLFDEIWETGNSKEANIDLNL